MASRCGLPGIGVAFALVVLSAAGGALCMPDGMSASKLSIHSGMGDASWQIIKNARPRVIKLLDTFGDAANIKAAVPGIQIVGRIYLGSQPQKGDPAAAALAWLKGVNNTIMQYPAVDFWEGYNEPDLGGGVSSMNWLATFDATRVTLLQKQGMKASIGNFGTGNPDITHPEIMTAYNPAIDAALAHGGILGLHEYSSPTMMGCFDNKTQTGWMTGRYRKWYQQILAPSGRGHLPLVISETGIDNSPCDNSPNYGGWAKYCAWWASNLGAKDCGAEYLRQLAWYDALLRADSYVIGATIFQLDIPGWGDYSLNQNNGVTDLIAYMNSVA